MPSTRLRAAAAAAAVALLASTTLFLAVPPAAAAPRYVQISGAGSTWSANAIDNWRRNVQQYGMVINYAATGSTDGRNQFKNGTVDFGVSEIQYGLPDSFVAGDSPPARGFAYMPIVAGGTAFMYNLKINGRRVTNLRLSGDVVAKIFTGVIKRWNDPAIKADNPGLNLPNRAIVPVYRSDGSGTTAQFTLWMSKAHPSIWGAYCAKLGKPRNCGLTSFFKPPPGGGFIGQSGSNGVSGYVAQENAEGAITYVEYSYAINSRFPVARILNQAGYYTEPTASNVAVALLSARIANDLTQNLDSVYRSTDPRTYPLSSYSYMILPIKQEMGLTEDKGYTLSSFAYYFLCQGQQDADVLGYSPLPINLVKAGFEQVKRIPGVQQQNINLAGCNNPTFSRDGTNTLARNAPQPSSCDKKGPTQNPAGTGGARQETPVSAGAACRTGGAASSANNANSDTGGPTGGASAGPTASVPAGVVDPDTGEVIGAGGGGGEAGQDVVADPVALAGEGGWGMRHTLMALAAVLLAGLVLGPPLLATTLRSRTPGGGR